MGGGHFDYKRKISMDIKIKKIIEAFMDLLDGQDENDIRGNTGLPQKRCVEIMDIYRNLCAERKKRK